MPRLNLTAGRYIPDTDGDTEARLQRMERYLARLTEELERILSDTDVSIARLEAWRADGEGADV